MYFYGIKYGPGMKFNPSSCDKYHTFQKQPKIKEFRWKHICLDTRLWASVLAPPQYNLTGRRSCDRLMRGYSVWWDGGDCRGAA